MNNEFEVLANNPNYQVLAQTYRQDEEAFVKQLMNHYPILAVDKKQIQENAQKLMQSMREQRTQTGGLDAFMFQYDLSSEEGIALMCMAEALLRIPDKGNMDKLIRDKLASADWKSHLGKSHSMFVNAATWALMLTGKVVEHSGENYKKHSSGLSNALKKLTAKGGEPIIRQAISHAMKILGKQFVMGRHMKEALKRAKEKEKIGYTYSYDMLGEAAFTDTDAKKYLEAYAQAIKAIGADNKGKGYIKGAGISIKLSALHPRYEIMKKSRLESELYERVKILVELAKEYNIGLTIDAEEADKLILSLELLEKILASGIAKGWDGLGLAVQAYQKRALATIDCLQNLSKQYQQKLCIRLVKGAYWDTEVKLAQEQGLSDYPVFTRKASTDLNYIACAKKLCEYKDDFYLQFATHNALSFCTIQHLCQTHQVTEYEFQCLHGMGDAMYDSIAKAGTACRIYAPVGSHEDLLPYLVRRLLENGANTSFVNRIANDNMPLERMTQSPVDKLADFPSLRHTSIPLPQNLYGTERLNSKGVDLSHPNAFMPVMQQISQSTQSYIAKATIQEQPNTTSQKQYSPVNHTVCLGEKFDANESDIIKSIEAADKAFQTWRFESSEYRATLLKKTADLLESQKIELYRLLMLEGGKILEDAVSELREAIDFCRYYAVEGQKNGQDKILTGPTGEENKIRLCGRGIIACISPWNFPLAIFLGQVSASLAAGNCVIAKPASQTTLVAQKAIDILHEAGFPKDVVQLLPARGSLVGEHLLKDARVKAVLFTGSTDTARQINQTLAHRDGSIVPFIAETGGQNAMIVDSSALPEQVVQDVITSSFKSAGQRCSALRVLFVQEDIADKVITMLQGAMAELEIGDPLVYSTDIGPVIDATAKDDLLTHAARMDKEAKKIYEVPLSSHNLEKGSFFAPRAYEIENISVLSEEIFGPILHVIRFKGTKLDQVISDINNTGYGLTLGIHSRIDETVEYIIQRAQVGNIYVNRNMIGAVVGVQPFGGEGLSGTGPKAGGPHYLLRLSVERTVSVNTTASGGNATLMSITEKEV